MSCIAKRTRSQTAPWNAGPLPRRYRSPDPVGFPGRSRCGRVSGRSACKKRHRSVVKESDDESKQFTGSRLQKGTAEAFVASSSKRHRRCEEKNDFEAKEKGSFHPLDAETTGKQEVVYVLSSSSSEDDHFDSRESSESERTKPFQGNRMGREKVVNRETVRTRVERKMRVEQAVQSDSDTGEVHVEVKKTATYRAGRGEEKVVSDTTGIRSEGRTSPGKSFSRRYSKEEKGKGKCKEWSSSSSEDEKTSESVEEEDYEAFAARRKSGKQDIIDLVKSSDNDDHYEKNKKKKREDKNNKFVGRKGTFKSTKVKEEVSESGWSSQSSDKCARRKRNEIPKNKRRYSASKERLFLKNRGKKAQEEEETLESSFIVTNDESILRPKKAQQEEETSESSFDSKYSISESDEDEEEEDEDEDEDNEEDDDDEDNDDDDDDDEAENEVEDLGGVEKENVPTRVSKANQDVKSQFNSMGGQTKSNFRRTSTGKFSQSVYIDLDQDSSSGDKSYCNDEVKDHGGIDDKKEDNEDIRNNDVHDYGGDVEHLKHGFIEEGKRTENVKLSRASRHNNHCHYDDADDDHGRNYGDCISESKGACACKVVRKDEKISTAKRRDNDMLSNIGVGDVNDGDNVYDDTKKGKEENNTASREDKGTTASVNLSLFDLIAQTISQKKELPSEDVKPTEEKDMVKMKTFPLKFSLEEPETSAHKTESKEKVDALWNELDFILRCKEVSFSDVHQSGVYLSESTVQSTSDLPPCQHQLILDDEIGVKCKICQIVMMEIKDVMPPMIIPTYGRAAKKDSLRECISVSNGFEWHEMKSHCQSSNASSGRTVWDVIPDLEPKLFKHQREGFEFIWKNLAGSICLENLKSNDSDDIGGCLVSHAPGTGKTLLAIAFLRSFLGIFDDCRPMILAPVILLSTWEREFKKWGVEVPFHILNRDNFSGEEVRSAVELFSRQKSKIQRGRRQNLYRIIKIYSWVSKKSILGISYDMFRNLTMERKDSDKEGQTIRKLLLECPGLLVLDEGHIARNKFSRTWQCLKRVKTQRRIMLSGTPFQNNFIQLFNTLYVIRPNFADGLKERFKDHQSQIEREDHLEEQNETVLRRTFATFSEGIEPQENSSQLKELRSIIDTFIHVYEGTNRELPGLRDYFVYLHPSSLQRCILDKLTERSNFDYDHKVSCISVHPSILLESKDGKDQALIQEHHSDLSKCQISDGVKVNFVVDLVQLCEALNEKVLVFSQFIRPLKIIKDHLLSFFGWKDGQEVKQLDGRVIDQKLRQSLIHNFNDMSKEVKVLLVSTKVCAEGIDLTGASRVVLLDLVWNPSVRRQAISRAYRIGQQKVVYAYNLIASATLEERKFGVQDIKDKFSQLVFSSSARNVALVDILTDCTDKVLLELIEREPSLFHRVLELKVL